MGTIISLPEITQKDDAKAHKYPFQLSIQTMEFLQASIFYTAFNDISTAQYIHIDGKLNEIEKIFTDKMYDKKTYDECWEFLNKYNEVFKKGAFQSVIISLNSHWDWYIRKLSKFIEFSRDHIVSPELDKKQISALSRISNFSIAHQLKILSEVTGVKLDIDSKDIENLKEMSRVRNLGLHNRWETDEKYMLLSGRTDIKLGEIRYVEIGEINLWHSILIKTLGETCRKVATKYVKAPAYQ